MKYENFIVLDIETTGFDPKGDDCIEFAAVRLDINGEVVDRYDQMFQSPKGLSPIVSGITGIRQSDLEGKPTLEEHREAIKDFIGTDPIVGHNISFDVDFLNGKNFELTSDLLDTLTLSQTILPAQNSYSLEALSHNYAFPNQPSHRAMNDVLATADLFKLLVTQVNNLKADTLKQITTLLPNDIWQWQWLFVEKLNWNFVNEISHDKNANNVYFIEQLMKANKIMGEINHAATDKMNLLETHYGVDHLAQSIVYAFEHQPSILVVPEGLMRQINWPDLPKVTGGTISLFPGIRGLYVNDSLETTLKSVETISESLARLVIKVTIWDKEWDRSYFKLYLTSEEQYIWDQKFSLQKEGVKISTSSTKSDVIVTTYAGLMDLSNLENHEIVTSHPIYLEESSFESESRTFSPAYLNAAVAIRREFVHENIRPKDVKLADRMFKSLNALGAAFEKMSKLLPDIYFANPPTNVYEKDIEINRMHIRPDLSSALQQAEVALDEFIAGLQEAGIEEQERAMRRAQKLRKHLHALITLDPEYRYFLFAEENKFYLQLLTNLQDNSALQKFLHSAKKFTVISPALTYLDNFLYWQKVFGNFNGKILSAAPSPLIIAADPEVNEHGIDKHFVTKLITQNKRVLLVAGSSFDAKVLYDDIFDLTSSYDVVIETAETIGLPSKVPQHLERAKGKSFILVAHTFWLDRAKFAFPHFDLIIFAKLAFEPNTRSLSKLYRGDRLAFDSYTLPKTTFRFKENMEILSGLSEPVLIFDQRLINKDYGSKILKSLPNFEVIHKRSEDILL